MAIMLVNINMVQSSEVIPKLMAYIQDENHKGEQGVYSPKMEEI